MVRTEIHSVLSTLGCEVEPVGDPRVRSLPTVHHLVTAFAATARPGTHVLDLVGAMHPTPALGGAPREASLAFLRQRERRGLYGAPIGWFDESGSGTFVVGIRSALILGTRAIVHSGAGIVKGSVASSELAETRAKEMTMLRALGVRVERRDFDRRSEEEAFS
jgi:isochorismate synthase EntC